MRLAAVAVLVFASMIVEARRAARNEHAQRARGGVEPAGDVYHLMQVAYPGVFLAMLIEGAAGPPLAGVWIGAGFLVFALSKALKWWAILSLGRHWTFRVIVVPATEAIASGPYRYIRHPNYVAVVGEIVSVALMAAARVSGPIGLAIFGALLVRRVAVENRALDAILRRG